MRSTFFLLMSHVSWCLFVICFLLGGFSVILFSCPLNANAHSYSVQFKSSPIIIVVNFRLVDFTLARLFSLLLKIWFPYNLTLPLAFPKAYTIVFLLQCTVVYSLSCVEILIHLWDLGIVLSLFCSIFSFLKFFVFV